MELACDFGNTLAQVGQVGRRHEVALDWRIFGTFV
jgi:pantothenate kinase type III